MPITKSAIKRVRSSERKYERNQIVRSELKTLFKKVVALASQDINKAKEEARLLTARFDKAAQKGIVPKEKANRKKSRLAKLIQKSSQK